MKAGIEWNYTGNYAANQAKDCTVDCILLILHDTGLSGIQNKNETISEGFNHYSGLQ